MNHINTKNKIINARTTGNPIEHAHVECKLKLLF